MELHFFYGEWNTIKAKTTHRLQAIKLANVYQRRRQCSHDIHILHIFGKTSRLNNGEQANKNDNGWEEAKRIRRTKKTYIVQSKSGRDRKKTHRTTSSELNI